MNAASMALVPASPRAFAYSAATGERVHAPGATSSPPTCNHGESNSAASVPNTASTNGIVVGSPGQSELSTKRCILCAPVVSSGSRSDGTAVSAA